MPEAQPLGAYSTCRAKRIMYQIWLRGQGKHVREPLLFDFNKRCLNRIISVAQPVPFRRFWLNPARHVGRPATNRERPDMFRVYQVLEPLPATTVSVAHEPSLRPGSI